MKHLGHIPGSEDLFSRIMKQIVEDETKEVGNNDSTTHVNDKEKE